MKFLWLTLFPVLAFASPKWLDSKLSREERLSACVRCHTKQHDQWRMGPHANGYPSIESYAKLVLAHKLSPPGEIAKAKQAMLPESICFRCHAPENMYESVYAGDFLAKMEPIFLRPAQGRAVNERKTGVDCITCHVQRDRVITSPRKAAKPVSSSMSADPDFCNPKEDPVFAKSVNCTGCHNGVTEQSKLKPGISKFKTTTCVACHMQNGHHEYWNADMPASYTSRPAMMKAYERLKISRSGNKLKIFWKNDFAPHEYASGPRLTTFSFTTPEGVPIGRFRFFSTEFENDAKAHLKDPLAMKLVPGQAAQAEFDLPKELKEFPKSVKLTVSRVKVYTFPENEGRVFFEKEYPVQR